MGSKALLLLGLVAAMLLLISSEARDLAETSKGEGLDDENYPGSGGGGYYKPLQSYYGPQPPTYYGPQPPTYYVPPPPTYYDPPPYRRGRCYGCCGGSNSAVCTRCCASAAEAAQYAAKMKPRN